MPLTSLGRVSNSSSRSFSNARGTIANVNYGRIVGSYDNAAIFFNKKKINSTYSQTVNLPLVINQACKDVHSGNC
jgi:hypothetical protein